MQLLKQLYYSFFGKFPTVVEPITGAGSNRQYFILQSEDDKAVIGVVGTSLEENQAFI